MGEKAQRIVIHVGQRQNRAGGAVPLTTSESAGEALEEIAAS